MKTKKQLEKLYTNSENIEEQLYVQRPIYDKTGFGFFLGQSAKKIIERNEPSNSKVKKDLNKIDDVSKDKENITQSKKTQESDQDKENRKESHAWCDELEHIEEGEYKGKSFKHISNFYCHNCHGYGHYAVDCKKPKFDNNNNNTNSRMFKNTNNAGNRRRSHNNESRERRQIICYRCNNIGHIVRNCRTLDNQCDGGDRINVNICQLCNNFRHIAIFCRMDKRSFNKNQNYRRNNKRSDDSLREEMKEQIEDFRDTFVKANEPESFHIVLEEIHHDALDKRIKSLIVCDSSY